MVTITKESDARYGIFDFRAACEEAPTDLQELLFQVESLPFRRRGYGEFSAHARICRPDESLRARIDRQNAMQC